LGNIISKSESISLSASARLIIQLGEQLISDEFVALMELIKNSYDADATEVKVYVDTTIETKYGIGKITLEDNGNGMIPSIIKTGFLRLSTNFKKEYNLSPHYKRRVLGDKGLGRLSIQRLGRHVNIVTNPRLNRLKEFFKEEDQEYLKDYNQFIINLDWNLMDMDVDLNLVHANVDYLFTDEPKYGTNFEISGIRNQNFWYFKKREEKRLKNEIFSMINPFLKEKKSKFEVYLTINGNTYTNQRIDENVIDKMSDIKVVFSLTDWIFKIDVERKFRYLKREANATIRIMEQAKFNLHAQMNYDDVVLKNSYTLDLDNMDIVKENYPYLKELRFDHINTGMAHPGNFKGVIYGTDFSIENRSELAQLINIKQFPDDIKTYNELKTIWEAANGVYVFRNDFRILPYGKADWIGFTKKSQTFKSNIFKEHTIAGYINIAGETSGNLVEQTNRQGIVEDEYGNNFLRLFKEALLEIIVRDDVKFRDGFEVEKTSFNNEIIETKNRILSFKRIILEEDTKDQLLEEVTSTANIVSDQSNYLPEEELKKMLAKYFGEENEIEKILTSPDHTIKMMISAIIDSLSKGKEVHNNIASLAEKINNLKELDIKIEKKNKQEKYIKDREINELHGLLPMIGQGIIVESLTHELNRIDENIKTYASKTKEALFEKRIDDIDQLIKNQQLIIDETIYLREQLNHLEPTYRKNNKFLEKIDVKEFLRETYIEKGPMNKKALNKEVNINIRGESFIVEANKGYLITIFDNLFLNSLYWVEDSKIDKNIYFEVYEDGKIILWDSGPGIHAEIEADLFEPFKSMKKDGRGLGLYIVKELLTNMNAEIYLLDERKNDRVYKFGIKFNNILEG